MFFHISPVNVIRKCFIRYSVASSRFVYSLSKTIIGTSYDQKVRSVFTSCKLNNGEYEWLDPKSDAEVVQVTFIDKHGKRTLVNGKIGDNVLYLAHRYGVELEGACEASLACTTCHCYISDDYTTKLPEATEKEEDLLDLAPFLRENSRLGCQIILDKSLDGIELELPAATRNFYVDGHKPKPH